MPLSWCEHELQVPFSYQLLSQREVFPSWILEEQKVRS